MLFAINTVELRALPGNTELGDAKGGFINTVVLADSPEEAISIVKSALAEDDLEFVSCEDPIELDDADSIDIEEFEEDDIEALREGEINFANGPVYLFEGEEEK